MKAYVPAHCASCGGRMTVVDSNSTPFKVTCTTDGCPNVDKIFYAHMVELVEVKNG